MMKKHEDGIAKQHGQLRLQPRMGKGRIDISLAQGCCSLYRIRPSKSILYLILAHVRKGSFSLLLPTYSTEVLKASQFHDNVVEFANRTRWRPLNDCDEIV